jgi:carbamoylphosphate synthase large subunit
MIGVDVNAINITENREHQTLKKLEYHLRLQKYVLPTLEERNCTRIWFPLVIRPSFTLEVQERLLCIKEDFDVLLTRGLEVPIHEVLLTRTRRGAAKASAVCGLAGGFWYGASGGYGGSGGVAGGRVCA